ncbi:integrase catalytic domain-containing protein [Trichonephila clavipes]|uniref:Integrase catalytic domain-containing protein n=1 Tax=Trichonephila clavipes TaxID=2585209 RepID=A0A8X6WAM4_TRICX|nr:integrase catalytic domain-containing protein [Trichonephila clavipes]
MIRYLILLDEVETDQREKNKQEAEKNVREAEIQLEKIKLSQIEKLLELQKVRKKSEKNPQTLESGEPSSITDKLESLVKSIKTLTIQVPVSRRGKCAKLYSDHGKTLVGANKELKRFLKLIKDSDDNLAGFLFAEGIEWKFIPPRAPSFGGLWEATVKSIKYHLKRVVSGSNLTYEKFLTVCIQIEGILNFRPLCPLSSNSDDLNALTPAHFLIGRSMTSVVEPNLIELKKNTLKKWQRITRLVQQIWFKWHRCYLSELQQRNKWQFKKQNVKVGDLVVLIEDNMPTFKWPLGRITEIYDALIRVVKVKTQFGEYKRAISRVCLLPMPV